MRKIALHLVGISMILTLAGKAWAQDAPVDMTFGIQRFLTAPGTENFLSIDGARVGKHLEFTVGLWDNFQYKPLVIFNYSGGELGKERVPIVEFHDQLEVMGTVSLFEWVQIGLVVPFTVYQTGKGLDPQTARPGGGLSSWGAVGDMRLAIKVRLLGKPREEGFGIAFVPVLSLPVGGYGPWAKAFSGEKLPTIHARFAFDYIWGGLHAGLNIGYLWREESLLYSTYMEDELTYGAGLSYRLHKYVSLVGEILGSVALTTRKDSDAKGIFTGNNAQMPLEGDAAIRFHFWQMELNVGGGGGFIPAVGTPMFRVFLGLMWTPAKAVEAEQQTTKDDRDLDGKPNKDDSCPDDPEDYDEFEDADGCPEDDNDKDGIKDGYDSCPLEPEDVDQFEDDDGCPDFDHDKDMVLEPTDACPMDPEDYDGFEDQDGCPEADNDKDGLLDADDLCPDDPEDVDEFEDEDGCPDTDNDKDGVPDKVDQCPMKPEVLNGIKDEDGCPDKGVVTAEAIEIKQQVNFETDSDVIVGEQSFQILDVVAAILKQNPEFKIEVQGHTDNAGTVEHNMDLSQRRAEAVVKYLIDKGVNADNLTAKGYGPTVPIADNKTKKGKAKNRRVEFHIVGAGGEDKGESMPAPEAGPGTEDAPPDEGGGDADMTFDIPAE